MQTAAPLRAGAVIGERYRILREIGGGGMGYVFEAEHVKLERSFALKVLRVGKWTDELVQRFEREARALAKVHSPRVAQVTDFGVESSIGPYYVMELVAGRSLQDRLDQDGPIPVKEAVRIGAEICRAVADVHQAGIVHRDLKPGNIGLPNSGPVLARLLDFGLAASIDDSFLTRITKSQQVLGSLPYIAPEQFTGTRPSPAQDVWALGVVLFEMLSARVPFDAPSTAALMHQILTSPVPSLGHIPAPVRSIVEQLLEKNPATRMPSAAAAAAALERVQLPEDTAPDLPKTVQSEVYRPQRSDVASAPTAPQPTSRPPPPPGAASGVRRRPLGMAPMLVGAMVIGGLTTVIGLSAFGGDSEREAEGDIESVAPVPATVEQAPEPASEPAAIEPDPPEATEDSEMEPAETTESVEAAPEVMQAVRASRMRAAPRRGTMQPPRATPPAQEPAMVEEEVAAPAQMSQAPPSQWTGEIIR